LIPRIKLFKRQYEAFKLLRDDSTNEVLYGGGARGGKSWLGCEWVVLETFDKPKSNWMIAREELTKLKDTTLLTFMKVISSHNIKHLFKYNASSYTMENLQTGSLVFFREIKYIPSDPEFDRIGSYDLTGCFLDEAQQIHHKARDVLRGRFSVLEGERLDGTKWKTIPKAFYSCNPAKNWIYADFVRPHKQGIIPSDRAFVPSLATDNPFVDEAYIENLKKADKVTIERLLKGNFEYDDSDDKLFETEDLYNAFSFAPSLNGTKYITSDIALEGADRFVIAVWIDFALIEIKTFPKTKGDQVISEIEKMANKHRVLASNVTFDADGLGAFISGFLKGAKPFKNGSKALKNENYRNLKTQCAYRMAKRFSKNEINLYSVKDYRDEIVAELEAHKKKNIDKDDRPLEMLSKDEVKLHLMGDSPDLADVIFMREIFELKGTTEGADIWWL